MADPIRISLRYIGPEVDSGEMDIDEVANALAGFSKAYGKIASDVSPDATYKLKVTALQESSFDVFITAAMLLSQSGNTMQQIEAITNAAKFVFDLLAKVIQVRKHTKGKNYTFNVDGKNNTVNIINIDKIEMQVPREVYELVADKLIDADINKIAAPLRERAVESVELKEVGDEKSGVVIDSSEREYFRPEQSVTRSVRETEVTGRFISLNKERNAGRFELKNGERIPYHYVGDDPVTFHADFSRKGQVRATVDAEVDESLTPISLSIKAVKLLQPSLDLSFPDSSRKVQ